MFIHEAVPVITYAEAAPRKQEAARKKRFENRAAYLKHQRELIDHICNRFCRGCKYQTNSRNLCQRLRTTGLCSRSSFARREKAGKVSSM